MRLAWATLLVAGLLASGCTSSELGCAIEAAPQEVPEDREAFNVTDSVKEEYPLLSELFATEGTTVDVECSRGDALFRSLSEDGADVRLADGETGHDVFLRYEGETYYAVLAKVVN